MTIDAEGGEIVLRYGAAGTGEACEAGEGGEAGGVSGEADLPVH